MTLSQRLEQAGRPDIVERLRRNCKNPSGKRRPSPRELEAAAEIERLRNELLYLVKLADWCAGQGFCQIEGIEDPEEWCSRKWSELGPPDGEGYSALALAAAIAKAREVQMLPDLTEDDD